MRLRVIQHCPVSIPLWCDCDCRTPKNVRQSVALFQSHYGAIATGVAGDTSSGVATFQSHYGAIATEVGNVAFAIAVAVSIPLWCDCDQTMKV